jgi:hypothetical protein
MRMTPVRQSSCKEVEKPGRRYRVRIIFPCSHRTIPQTHCTACPLGASCRLPFGCIGRQRHLPQSGYRTRPYSVGPSRFAADSIAKDYDQSFNISSLNIVIDGHSSLHVCRLIITYTLWEAMKAMGQAFLPITEANRKGNLKNGRIYLLYLEAPGLPESQWCGACPTPDRSWLRTIYPCRYASQSQVTHG